MQNKLLVPDIGDFENVEVIEVLVKTGDKVSKGDLLITLNSTKQSEEKSKKTDEEKIPKDTEKIIEEAEKTITKNIESEKEDEPIEEKPIQSKKKTVSKIEVINKGDIDPAETKEWLESLSAVLNNDGKERAQYLIKQLIEHSYKRDQI